MPRPSACPVPDEPFALPPETSLLAWRRSIPRARSSPGSVHVAIVVEERAEGRVGRVVVEGELDLGTCGVLVDAVRRVVRDRPAAVEVDLRAVSFLEVVGAGALIRCRRMVNASGGSFRLVAPSAAAWRLLEATGLDAVFDVLDGRGT